jgi:hypothetical protein
MLEEGVTMSLVMLSRDSWLPLCRIIDSEDDDESDVRASIAQKQTR